MVSSGENSAIFTFSPLPSGFGNTLGNGARRVLLSSLPGAAITAIKVVGATHEYSTLPGVKDSVLNIILNLKKIQFKKHSAGSEIVSLQKKGEGKVFARDIKVSSDIEILNPDLVITTLNGKNDSISMEINIGKGVGYLAVRDRLEKEEFGNSEWILVDAAFSPVKHVNYTVSPTRVGEMTNLDKLEIEIRTNGAISPEDSIKFAAELLTRYFNIFKAGSEEVVEPEFLTDFARTVEPEKEAEEMKESYTPIEILNLSPRTLNALINGDIGSIEELTQCSMAKLSTLRGFGKKAQEEVLEALKKRGLTLSGE